jgi:hypothetical protein
MEFYATTFDKISPRCHGTQRTFPSPLEFCLSIEDADLLFEKANLA